MKVNDLKKIATLGVMGVLVLGQSVGVAAYSGSAAANYAVNHAKSYSSSFPSFENDCTNFVSQCAFYGGIPMDKLPSSKVGYGDLGDVYKTRSYWDCRKWTITTTLLGFQIRKKTDYVYTSTWSVVAKNQSDSWWGFYNYMKDNGASCKEYSVDTKKKLNTFIQACNVGDVLQLRDSEKNNKKHSVIVTKKTYDKKNKRYDMEICYHSNDAKSNDFRTKSWKAFGKDQLWTRINLTTVS